MRISAYIRYRAGPWPTGSARNYALVVGQLHRGVHVLVLDSLPILVLYVDKLLLYRRGRHVASPVVGRTIDAEGMPRPNAAAARARLAAPNITSWKPETNASSIDCCARIRRLGSIASDLSSAPAIFGNSLSICARAAGGNARLSSRGFTSLSNVRTRKTPKTAIVSNPATRATVLLMPEATPA